MNGLCRKKDIVYFIMKVSATELVFEVAKKPVRHQNYLLTDQNLLLFVKFGWHIEGHCYKKGILILFKHENKMFNQTISEAKFSSGICYVIFTAHTIHYKWQFLK